MSTEKLGSEAGTIRTVEETNDKRKRHNASYQESTYRRLHSFDKTILKKTNLTFSNPPSFAIAHSAYSLYLLVFRCRKLQRNTSNRFFYNCLYYPVR